ncbi:PAS domain S-box protein [Paenibacillus qinlingensis]|uniref:histidine kinase n=1 Tax=Paenibacillus qinlingensis TaxID=1837343 RepID=A0ABU1NQK6_9BACL|nr:PAS domain S-box protein [Paenibacillus qinlingensis]MDR6549765.1 PAS domain S-box-containing protein [Paenibacillus qinlingensis]
MTKQSEMEPSFDTIFEFITMGMALISLDGQWLRLNRSLCDMLGYSETELLTTNIKALLEPAQQGHFLSAYEKLQVGTLTDYQLNMRIQHKNLAMMCVDWRMSVVRDSDYEPQAFLVQVKEISEQSEMERKLAESEQRYKSLIEHNPAGILTCDIQGRILGANPAMERILGYSKDELHLQLIHHLFQPKDPNLVQAEGMHLRNDNYMLKFQQANGEIIELGVKNVPIIVNGEWDGVYLIAKDITQFNRDRESLRIAQQDLHDTVRRQQGMTLKFRKINGNYVHTLCDGELLYRLGYKPSHILGKTLYEIWPTMLATSIEAYYHRAWNGEENVMFESTFRGITYITSLRPIMENERMIEVIGSCVNITERKQMEIELRETKELLESVINNTSDAISVLDLNARVISVNAAHEHIFGWSQEELMGRTLPIYPSYLENERKEMYEQLRLGKQISGKESVRLRKDGRLIHVSITKTPIKNEKGEIFGFAAITRDITERNQTEELLRKSDKLAVAGQLAAGLAHEIRNPLTSLRGFLQLLQHDMKDKKHYFDIMLSELDRINFIVSEFLVIAKPEAITYKKSSLETILQSVIALLDTQAVLCNVELLLEFQSEIPEITCSEMHLKQLFINLIKNAMEAISKDGQIKMIVSLHGEDLIRVRTQDNGSGIPEDRMKQLGEPFYTTKEKGTGLGLMMCFKIVEAHRGTMSIESQVGYGTTIDVYLPTDKNEPNLDT